MTLKKSALSAAVAAALALPAASGVAYAAEHTMAPDFYGRMHFRLLSPDEGDLNLFNAGHRLGWRGGADMRGGAMVGYHVETEFGNFDEPAFGGTKRDEEMGFRLANMYYEGGFGKITIGRQANTFGSTHKADIFEQDSGVFLNDTRFGDAIMYSNTVGPVSFAVGGMIDRQPTGTATGDDGDDLDSIVGSVEFAAGPVDIALALQENGEDGSAGSDQSYTGVGVNYEAGPLQIAGHWVDESESETGVLDIAVVYAISKTTKIGGSYAAEDQDTETPSDPEDTRTLLHVAHDLGGGADVYGWISTWDEEDTNDSVGVGFRAIFN